MENTEDMHVFQQLHKNWIFSCDFVYFDVIRQITFLKKEKHFYENTSLKQIITKVTKTPLQLPS